MWIKKKKSSDTARKMQIRGKKKGRVLNGKKRIQETNRKSEREGR